MNSIIYRSTMARWNLIKFSVLLSNLLRLCLSDDETCSDPSETFDARDERMRQMSKDDIKIEEGTIQCECCIAVSHVLHFSFESAHKKLPKSVGRLSYTDIIDITGKQVKKNSNYCLKGRMW